MQHPRLVFALNPARDTGSQVREPWLGGGVYVAMGKRLRGRFAMAAIGFGCTLGALTGPVSNARAALPLRGRGPTTMPGQPSPVSSYQAPPAAVVPPPFTITPPPLQIPPPDANTNGNYSLSRDVIRRVVWVHINQIKFCYQQALVKQPMLAGRLTAVFQIDPQGHVQSLALRDSELPPLLLPGPGSAPPVVAKPLPLSQAPQLLSCVGDAMRIWDFPPTPYYSGMTEITYPFVLKPRIPDPPPGIQVSDDELTALGIQRDPEPPSVDILF